MLFSLLLVDSSESICFVLSSKLMITHRYYNKKGTVLNSKYLDKKVFLYSKEVQLLNYLV